jgi:YVTN family beta-propeller protein
MRLLALQKLLWSLVLIAIPAVQKVGAADDSASTATKNTPIAWEAPAAVATAPGGGELFVACAKSSRVSVLETRGFTETRSIALPGNPSGLALSTDGKALYVTCSGPVSELVVIDVPANKILRTIKVGHTALSPVISPDGALVYVCNRFDNSISVVDPVAELVRIPVDREPVSAAITSDGKYLLVANHLHNGRSDAGVVAAKISVIDTATRKVIKELQLPNGSGLLHDIRISPDGRYACVAHVLAHYQLPTTQLERGWMNSNAMTLIDLANLTVINTVLLDNVDSGAANPWAVGWMPDGKTLFITHAGTHELSLIDFPAVLAKLQKLPEALADQDAAPDGAVSRVQSDVPSDLSFLAGVRIRVPLKGKGARSAVVCGERIVVADYFTDTLESIDPRKDQAASLVQYPLGTGQAMSVTRKGESLFNDATLCFQGWQTCASCHTEDARTDALNWDLINDGIGNPKNSKSLLFSHMTPPVMSLGIRENAEAAVRSGIRYILFTTQPDDVPEAIDAWLKTLRPVPSPHLENGKLSKAARRGKTLFESSETRCASCHKGTYMTDLQHHDVGTICATDKPGDLFDTPTLIEIWRTAPYLHDGSAVTLREVVTSKNTQDHHGKTSQLTPRQIDDLVEYLRSL